MTRRRQQLYNSPVPRDLPVGSLGMGIGDKSLDGPVGGSCGSCSLLARAAVNSKWILHGCRSLVVHVEICHASGVLGWEGWRLLLLLLLLANKKLLHHGIGDGALFASCGDLLVGWHG